jgi:sugar (pentulose or hexulose) kinase
LLGFYALGIIPDLKGCAALIKVRDEYQPDAERHGIYRQQYQLFGALYERIKDLM